MKRFVKTSVLLGLMVVLLSSCNCYNKMAKNVNDVKATSNPELLTLKGNTVTAEITVNFPAKYFHKTAVFRITPVLTFDGGQLQDSPKYLQGEKVKDNYTVISYKSGGSYSQTVTFPYDERANISTLELRIEARCKKGDFTTVKVIPVAQGVSTVQNYANYTAYLTIMPDNFRRVTTISQEADLVYMINSAQVRNNALSSEQIKLFEEFVKDNSDKYRTTLGTVYSKGYASPDGPVKFNDELSQKRSQTGQQAISKQLKDVDARYDAAAYGEDWEGFRKLVEQSNIPDRDLILQVLQMYSSPVERDVQIKNMSQVYDVLKKDILPQLRRTQLVASADIEGKTDNEIRDYFNSNINELNLEEILYAATLFNDDQSKEKAYKTAAEKYNDERAYNNYGVILARNGKYAEAKSALNRASSLRSAPEISNNLGVVALAEGNTEEAKRYLNPLNSKDATSNKALIALKEGDYAVAVRGLDGYNLAVAEFCNGNLSQAKAALGNTDCPCADYLRAIIAMREGDTRTATSSLEKAYAKDPSLRTKAQKDIEFARLSAAQ